ncbi:hypothetical protein [Salipiger sp. PrR003]|uniref:hypothetical protein n=1 Tax=Salipiger sp. PrR003 TaxID=2706776 RepID=UPI0013DA2B0C|nr:hypothetical protein [Salipiger sp. PrR003]NDV52260.1 hypothetical protein [Salipiger sp. PrR003]
MFKGFFSGGMSTNLAALLNEWLRRSVVSTFRVPVSKTMDWSDPAQRLELLEAVGPEEYGRRLVNHERASVIEIVNGYPIRLAKTRFGMLFALGGTEVAYSSLAQAREQARKLGPRVA